MPKYRVIFKEETLYEAYVEADSAEEAEQKVYDGEGEVSPLDSGLEMEVTEVEELD